MIVAVFIAVAAAAGVHLLVTSSSTPHAGSIGWFRQRWTRVRYRNRLRRHRMDRWLESVGLGDVNPRELLGVMAGLFVVGAVLGFALLGGVLPAIAIGGFAATFPVASARARRRAKRNAARDSWPRLIEEIRIQTSALGRSIPQALFEVGRRSPPELRPAFEAAHREWLITTDFERTIAVLKSLLADPTADATCETLLVAYGLGGADLDGRLEALIEDRIIDTNGRKDARAKQAGARFARRFVLLVPLGMAVAGMSVGPGRESYQTPAGQFFVVIAIAMVIACWVWAGRLMRLPEEQRVFSE